MIIVITLMANFFMSKYQTDLQNNAMKYADLMSNIPTEFGVWKRTKADMLPWYAIEQLRVIRAENWEFTNELTGEQVLVSFLVGPTGRLSVHTAEACMDGQGYRIAKERQRERFSPNDVQSPDDWDANTPDDEITPAGVKGEKKDGNTKTGNSDDHDEFWRVDMVSRLASEFHVVTYYALGTGKRWWAMDKPRFELARYPFVLKMHVETTTTEDPMSYNAARLFLRDFLPEVAKVYAETDLQGKYGNSLATKHINQKHL